MCILHSSLLLLLLQLQCLLLKGGGIFIVLDHVVISAGIAAGVVDESGGDTS